MSKPEQHPPSDAVMCKVIAKWKGLTCVRYLDKTHPDTPPTFITHDNFSKRGSRFICPDPRTDTDAALELARWLCGQHGFTLYGNAMPTWAIVTIADNPMNLNIPESGQGFRTAICNLAAEVLGVDEGGE